VAESSGAVPDAERGEGQGRRIPKQLVPLGGAGVGEPRPQELTNNAEPEALLELTAAGCEHLDAGIEGPRTRLGEELGLPDSRRTLDQNQRAAALRGRLESSIDPRELLLALEQPARRPGSGRRRLDAESR
jgi:hypothetical protein